MSVAVETRSLPNATLVRFAETEPVGIPAVQDTLTALWRAASEDPEGERESALARACMWNLVAFHGNPQRPRGDSGGEARRIEELLEQVTAAVPARVIHLEEWRDESAPEPGKEVEAWVGTHCLQAGSGPKTVCCEQIKLAGYGDKGHSHFPALVRALLVADLPMGLLWLDDVPRQGRVLSELVQMSERVIVDTQRMQATESLLAAHALHKAAPGKLADLGWLRLNALRHLLADFFDPTGRAEQLARLDSIAIETSPKGRSTGYLLLGWLLSRCGYRDAKPAKAKGGKGKQSPAPNLAWKAARPDGGTCALEFRVAEGDGGLDGIFCIELQSGTDRFALRDVDPEHMSVDGPDGSRPSVALREATEPEALAGALGGPRNDRVFAEALTTAAALVDSRQARS